MTKQREGAAITPPEEPGQWDGVGWNWKHVHPTRGERLDEAIALTKALLNRLAVLRKITELEGQGMSLNAATCEVGLSLSTGSRWQKAFDEGGLVALLHKKRTAKVLVPCPVCTGSGQHPTDAHLLCLQCCGEEKYHA